MSIIDHIITSALFKDRASTRSFRFDVWAEKSSIQFIDFKSKIIENDWNRCFHWRVLSNSCGLRSRNYYWSRRGSDSFDLSIWYMHVLTWIDQTISLLTKEKRKRYLNDVLIRRYFFFVEYIIIYRKFFFVSLEHKNNGSDEINQVYAITSFDVLFVGQYLRNAVIRKSFKI